MRKVSKRAANKQKLASLEWTDEAIEQCSNAGPNAVINQAASESKDLESLNTMEAKIARVQQRKKEAEERDARNEKKHATISSSPLKKLFKEYLTKEALQDGKKLAGALNAYFMDLLSQELSLITEFDTSFPLDMYDSSEFDEALIFPTITKQDLYGVSLIYEDNRRLNDPIPKFGKWFPCKIMRIEPDSITVEIEGDLIEDTYRVHQMQVCLLESHNVETYVKRISAALRRRNICVGLMRYYSYIRSMPNNPRITSSMTDEQFDRIFRRAANNSRLQLLRDDVGDYEIQEARAEFEIIMNKILLDSMVLSARNSALFQSLKIPPPAFGSSRPVPFYGLVVVPNYNYKGRITYHRTTSFICSVAAIRSLQVVLKENKVIDEFQILKISYTKPFTIDKFERYINEQMVIAARLIKQDWPVKIGRNVRQAITKGQENDVYSDCIKYDINLRNVFELENSKNQIRFFLERLNFMMTDVLYGAIERNLLSYTETVEDLCSCSIQVKDIREVKVHIPEESLYKRKCLPPLFLVAFRVAAEDRCLNTDEVEQNKKEIAAWMKTKEGENGEKCPIKVIAPLMGKTFEYSTAPSDFKDIIMKGFRQIVADFLDVPHLQKYVMEKIYFPSPRFIPAITLELPWVKEAANRTEAAMDRALDPIITYLTFFKKFEKFVNIDNAVYIATRITDIKKDPDSNELELPVTVNLVQLMGLIDEHLENIRDIEASLPITPIECGLFLVDVVTVRNLLLDKHRAIIRRILSDQAERCAMVSEYLEEEFKKIEKNLSKRPENIEQLMELEEYISSLTNILGTLQNLISEMMNYYNVLEKYKYKTDQSQRWKVFACPANIASKCSETLENNLGLKRRFKDEMLGEQAAFSKSIHELDHQIAALENLVDLSEVNTIAATVRDVESRLIAAQAKVKLFNARETLFENDITDYEELNRLQRNFEPYLNLWQTTKEWIELSLKWKRGRFVDLNAEEVEKNVDKYNVAITKAAKFFAKADMKHQSTIASKIKAQVSEFLPEVPMIVTLRNPGMRDRHWIKIAEALQVDIMPIENFTTDQIIALNLKDSLDLIQKIGESAAKEYQIEQALNKMEHEWEEMNLNIHNYRETGTGVLKGIDDINVVLDEQITMTQVNMP